MIAWNIDNQANQGSSFGFETAVAAILSIGGVFLVEGGLLAHTLGHTSYPVVAPSMVAALAGLYQLYLCARSNSKVGRVTLLLSWLVITASALALSISPLAFIWSQLLMVSLTRALLFHPRPLAFAADLALNLVGAVAALWMLLQTGSTLLTIWTYFLVQAGWSWIGRPQTTHSSASDTKAFDAAHASAAAAIRRLTRRSRA